MCRITGAVFTFSVFVILILTKPRTAYESTGNLSEKNIKEHTHFSLACDPGQTGPRSRVAWYSPHVKYMGDLKLRPLEKDTISEWNGTAVVRHDKDHFEYTDYKQNGRFILHVKNLTSPVNHVDLCCYLDKTMIRCFRIHVLVPVNQVQLFRSHPWDLGQEQIIDANEGEAVTIQCKAPRARPVPSFNWTLNGKPVPPEKQFSTSAGDLPNSVMLKFLADRSLHGHEITCTANNTIGEEYRVSSTATLNIKFAPIITALTVEPTIPVEGSAAVIKCVTDGNPAPTPTWTSSGGQSQNQTEEGKSNGELRIRDITRQHHQRKYECTAVNPLGHVEKSIELQVFYSPEVNVTFDNQTRRLSCSVDGRPSNFRFKIAQTLETRDISTWHNKTNLSTISVDLAPFTFNRTGLYVCSVSNDIGSRQAELFIRSNTVPILDHHGPDTFFAAHRGKGRLRVLFYAYPPYTSLSWLKYGANASTGKDLYHFEDSADVLVKIAGVLTRVKGISSNVFISQVTPEDMGVYAFSVVNSEGEAGLDLTLLPEDHIAFITPEMIVTRTWTVVITLFACILFTSLLVFTCIAVLRVSGLSVKVAKRRKDRSWWPAKRLSAIYYTWRGKIPDVDGIELSKMERDPVYLRPPSIHGQLRASDRRKPINSVLSVVDTPAATVPMKSVEEQSEDSTSSVSDGMGYDYVTGTNILPPVSCRRTNRHPPGQPPLHMFPENKEMLPISSLYMSSC